MMLNSVHPRNASDSLAELIAAKDAKIAELEAEKVHLQDVIAGLRLGTSDLYDTNVKLRHELDAKQAHTQP